MALHLHRRLETISPAGAPERPEAARPRSRRSRIRASAGPLRTRAGHHARAALGVLMVAFTLTACGGGGAACPDGSVPADGRCLAPDAATDAATDAVADAGACGGDCPGATPMCDPTSGACVACLTDSDCGGADASRCDLTAHRCVACLTSIDCRDSTPACVAGSCASCLGHDCTPQEATRQHSYLVCLAVSAFDQHEPGVDSDGLDALQMRFCSGRSDLMAPSRTNGPLLTSLRSGRMTISGADWMRCANLLEHPENFEDCMKLRSGVPQVDLGDACYDSRECVDGFCDTSACPGSCVPRPTLGEPCVAHPCAAPYVCTAGLCAAVGTIDQPCNSATCAATLVCDSTGHCVAPLGDGEPCSRDAQCARPAICDGTGHCGTGSVGTACSEDLQCASGLVCRTMQCRAPSALGGPCAASSGTEHPACTSGLKCVSGTCATPRATAESCAIDTECAYGNRCVAGACRTIQGPSDACDATHPCALGLACVEGICATAPDIGEACSETGSCLRGTCTTGVCRNQGTGDACTRLVSGSEYGDSCGDLASCTDSLQCSPEVDVGASCGGAMSGCRAPAYCDGAVCVADCAPSP